MTKSVLVVNHFAVPRGRPGGTRHVELFERLGGWRYMIIASELNHLTGERQEAKPGFRPVKVAAYSSNGWRRVLNWISYAWSAFWVGVRQRRIDVVYASSPHLFAAFAGWAIAFVRRKPLVLEVRDLWPKVLADMQQLSVGSPLYIALTALEEFLYRRAKAIVVMADGSRTELLARGVPWSKISYIPNGADPADFVPSDTRENLRARYNFDRFTAVYAGAHGPANGLDLLLRAAAKVQDLPLEIVLIGGGVAKSALQVQAAELALTNVTFRNPVPKEEVPDLLAAADLGLHVLADVELFRTSVSPNKLFDYMAAGLPVLTNCPGLVSELVMESGGGLTTSPQNIANGIRQAIASNELEEYGSNGREWILRNQSRRAMSRRLADLLRRVSEGISAGD
ncbi:glycosyltransferase family 4 protein [Pseudactinotalea sp. Z1748]|uniref:glycosyltransferase family 4 protein n=1 Tax=Pseudactinotalea sp. Z1748 TaxID=3413027 RepID=UPI003C7C0B98